MVEPHVANVAVASSNLVSRSIKRVTLLGDAFFNLIVNDPAVTQRARH